MQPRIMSRDVKSSNGAGAPVRLAARDKPFQVSNIAMPVGIAVGYVHAFPRCGRIDAGFVC